MVGVRSLNAVVSAKSGGDEVSVAVAVVVLDVVERPRPVIAFFDSEVVHGHSREFASSRSGFDQTLSQGDGCRNTEPEHLINCQCVELANVRKVDIPF